MVMWDEIARECGRVPGTVPVRKLLVTLRPRRSWCRTALARHIVATRTCTRTCLVTRGRARRPASGSRPGEPQPERAFVDVQPTTRGLRHHRQGRGQPLATFWTVALMLEHLGEMPAAGAVMAPIESLCREGRSLPARQHRRHRAHHREGVTDARHPPPWAERGQSPLLGMSRSARFWGCPRSAPLPALPRPLRPR